MTNVVGVDIGGTKIAAALVDEHGRLVGPALRVPTPSHDGPAAIVHAVLDLVARLEADELRAVGIGTAGAVDPQGTVVSATDLLPGWAGTPLAAQVAARTGCVATALNDVHAAALAECRVGAARGAGRAIVAAVGTGVGGAVVLDGAVQTGPRGLAGSLGHVPVRIAEARTCSCGQIGHAEAYAAGPRMEADYRGASGTPLDLQRIGELAATGDSTAAIVIAAGAAALGQALASTATVVDPDVIVVGGGVTSLGELLLAPTREAFRRSVMPPMADIPIVRATTGTDAALVGAALFAWDALQDGRAG